MKNYISITLTTIFVVFFASCQKNDEKKIDQKVTYKVTFNAFWSSTTHPDSFPPGPHFSGLIGASHKNANVLFTPGLLASEGIKTMAEIGVKAPLLQEIDSLIQLSQCGSVVSGGGIGVSPGSVSVDVEMDADFPLVTLVSMLAPSPDWFVAAEDVSLIENHQWVQHKTVPISIYDAGTDAGNSFTSSNQVENPPKVITLINTPPLATSGVVASLGEMVFELQP